MQGNLKPILARLAEGATLSEQDAEQAFATIMAGEATPAQIAGLLMAMRVRGETVAELTGAVRAMRARMVAVEAPDDAIDVCGTGGDSAGTLNVSTAATFVLAGCVFLFAPRHHAALRHAAGPRTELGTRTIFNLLGPLANPARVRRQLTGVFAPVWARPMAETLARLGSEAVWIVHGQGLDELTVAGENHVVALRDGAISTFTVTPEDAGLPRAPLAAIRGGDAAQNAQALAALLHGAPGAYRDTVLFNAAAALVVAGRARGLAEGVALAARALDTGAAQSALDALRRETAPPPPEPPPVPQEDPA